VTLQTVRSVPGAFVSSLEAPYGNEPGNYGVRVYAKKLSTVYKTEDQERDELMGEEEHKLPRTRLTNQLGYMYNRDNDFIPQKLENPRKVDYPTDDESDEGGVFNIKVRVLYYSRFLNCQTC